MNMIDSILEEFIKKNAPDDNVAVLWNLQLCSNVDKLFETLLDNQEINYKKRKRVMDICRDWAVK